VLAVTCLGHSGRSRDQQTLKDLAFLRQPDREYLIEYPPEFKLRLLPSHIHENHNTFYKRFASDPMVELPKSMKQLKVMFTDGNERLEIIRRIIVSALAQLESF
jgi:hypothetical protein